MRERTTWNRTEIVKLASMAKTADPYTMNQDHKNPPTSKYQNGDPSSWGEDVHSPNEWEKEYANGQTKRDEIGLPAMRADSLKNASDQTLLVKKADLCVKVARAMLGKKAAEEVVEDQAVAFMALDDSALIDTFNRLANDDQQGQQAQEEPKQAQQEQQEQAAPPAQQQQAQQQEQAAPPAQQEQTASAKAQAAMQSGDQEGMKAAIQQMVQEAMQQAPAQQAPAQQMQASKKAQDQQGQGQAQQDQKQAAPQMDLAAMVQQAVQTQFAQQQGQQAPEPAQDQMQANDQMLLDEMLAAPDAPMDMGGAGDIELDAPSMDLGGDLGPEDADLKMLFATQETQDAEQAQQAQEKQASVRTASTRTVGTKPTAGVSRVGGFGQTKTASAGNNDVDKLSNLWATAPDVKEHFGIK